MGSQVSQPLSHLVSEFASCGSQTGDMDPVLLFCLHFLCQTLSAYERMWHLTCFSVLFFQPKERGSTRVHALNNVNRVLQVLHQNNVSNIWGSLLLGVVFTVKPAGCSNRRQEPIPGNVPLW